MSADGVEFTADLRYTVQLGALHDVELKWPGWRAEGWQSVRALSADGKSQDVEYLGESGNESVRIRVYDPSKREFRQILRARRELSGDGKTANLSLPRVVATSPRQPILIVADAENVESKVTPLEGTTVRTLPAGRRTAIEVPEEFRNLSRNEYQIESPVARFSAGVTVRQRQWKAESFATADLAENRIRIEQRINYDVRFEPASEIGLLAPKSLQRRVQVALEADGKGEIPLNPTWTPQESGNAEKARFTLPDPRTGKFDVIARYDVELPDDRALLQDTAVSLPLMQSSDTRIAPVRLSFRNAADLDIAVPDAGWVLEMPRNDDPLTSWLSAGEASAVPVRLSKSRRELLQDYTIRRARIRTLIQPEGSTRVRAQYRIEGAVSSINLTLPPGSVLPNFWWDARRLETKSEAIRDYHLELAKEMQRGSHLLTVEYATPAEVPIGWVGQTDAQAPRFPAAIWTEELLWEVVVPFDHYLWNYPEGFTPEFSWQRQSFAWARTPQPPYDDPETWIGAVDGPADPLAAEGGNSYVFSRAAPATEMRVVSLNQSMIVLLGAGIALGMGFLLLKVPALHNALTPLLFAFVAAAAWLVAAAPMQLLLQPALLGLCLAVLAAFIDRTFKKTKGPVYMALPPASDFASPPPIVRPVQAASSSVDRPVLLGAGSDDPTALRPAPEDLAESLSSSDSGNSR